MEIEGQISELEKIVNGSNQHLSTGPIELRENPNEYQTEVSGIKVVVTTDPIGQLEDFVNKGKNPISNVIPFPTRRK